MPVRKRGIYGQQWGIYGLAARFFLDTRENARLRARLAHGAIGTLWAVAGGRWSPVANMKPKGPTMTATKTKERIEPALLTTKEAARLLSVGPRTLSRWAADGRAPAGIKLTPGQRGAIRWRRSELLRWCAAGCPDLRTEGGAA